MKCTKLVVELLQILMLLFNGYIRLFTYFFTWCILLQYNLYGYHSTAPAIINVTLPEEPSSQEFFSPNYPESFPDHDLITWAFQVPYKYYSTVHILNYTQPRCDTKETRMEYQINGKTFVKKLTEAQLSEHQGSFTLSLQNCNVDTQSTFTSLTLRFKVSAVRRGSEGECGSLLLYFIIMIHYVHVFIK